jgi:hypothetical protein
MSITSRRHLIGPVVILASAMIVLPGLFAVAPDEADKAVSSSPPKESTDGSVPPPAPSRAEARERAEMLHEFILQTLLSVHEHYYREDENLLLPATTLRGVFEQFGKRHSIQVRWLAVDAEPMNIEHRPQNEFEHAAMKAMKSGRLIYDEIVDDRYQYAGTITLTSECLKCHVPNRTSTRDRLAGLVITMPVAGKPGQ